MSRTALVLCLVLALAVSFAGEADAHKVTNKCKNVRCARPSNPCRYATCNPATGKCVHKKRAEGAKCADRNKCTVNSKCSNGKCIGVAKVCKAPVNNPCANRVCDLLTGRCLLTPTNEGGVCNDGKACTENDKCYAGKCVGTPKVCNGTAFGPCKSVKCTEPTGECTATNKTDGTRCGDGDRCTVQSVCMGGTCSAGKPKNCTSTQCVKRTCNPLTGRCDAEFLDKVPCDDGKKCTEKDTCVNGVCRGTPIVCPASTTQCKVNRCNEATGACDKVSNAPNYSLCDDGNVCTFGERCMKGKCVGRPKCGVNDPKKCTVSTCTSYGPDAGKCVSSLRRDGARCSDGNWRTKNDRCQNGFCKGK